MTSFMPGPRERRSSSDRERAYAFVEDVFKEQDLHGKRLESLANGVVGALRTARASIHAIGQAYAEVAEIKPKHGIKQVDRFLSNPAFDVWRLLTGWCGFVVGARKDVVISLDWTDFEGDDQMTLSAYVVTTHGRATPLAWRTVRKSDIKGRQAAVEHEFLATLSASMPPDVAVTILADRGFAHLRILDLLDSLGWQYVIRSRTYILIEHGGRRASVPEWKPSGSRALKLKDACITNEGRPVAAVILVRAPRMKEGWCLLTSLDAPASQIVRLYGKRFTIEETFRDQKDLRYGLGLNASHIRDPARRDRLLLLLAIAQALLTLLGTAAEEVGLDRALKANTSPKRTHSLFRQGSYWYGALPTMREDWFRDLMAAFDRIVANQPLFADILGAI